MFSKIVVLACALAVCQAGFLPTQYAVSSPALTSTSDQIYRSAGNLAQIATQSKTISTPFSSSSKSDIRFSNPGVYAHATPLAYAAPAPAQLAYAQPAYAQPAYAQPAQYAYAAPAPAPLSYAAPAPAIAAAPAVAHGASLLGVAYSPAVAVSHMTYSSPIGISYSY